MSGMGLYFGRCPACRCSRIHRDEGWAEVSFLGWTVGAYWRSEPVR